MWKTILVVTQNAYYLQLKEYHSSSWTYMAIYPSLRLPDLAVFMNKVFMLFDIEFNFHII